MVDLRCEHDPTAGREPEDPGGAWPDLVRAGAVVYRCGVLGVRCNYPAGTEPGAFHPVDDAAFEPPVFTFGIVADGCRIGALVGDLFGEVGEVPLGDTADCRFEGTPVDRQPHPGHAVMLPHAATSSHDGASNLQATDRALRRGVLPPVRRSEPLHRLGQIRVVDHLTG